MDFSNPKPIYRQIVDYVFQMVISGEWQPGTRIMSVRELAASVEVNPNTAVRAYSYLGDADIIFQKRGIGYFLSEDALPKAIAHERERFITESLPDVFDMMTLLNIDIKELDQLLKKHRENEK